MSPGMERTTDQNYPQEQLLELEAERDYMARYVEERKPYWLSLRHPRDGELQWELNNYAPLAHHDRAITAIEDWLDDDHDRVAPDGGYGELHTGAQKSTVF